MHRCRVGIFIGNGIVLHLTNPRAWASRERRVACGQRVGLMTRAAAARPTRRGSQSSSVPHSP